ncbi:mitochondrial carrier [Violaceomyces palustris]|uniref:Mitochondrial carrier n=1 Tax=Violaceomyces palustris TaxID=1673888 RepID=A0ACD0NMV1_9BASI|nr:mitochondrial carrier [Violaceomyces palustris]
MASRVIHGIHPPPSHEQPWPSFKLPFTDLAAGSLAGAAQVIVGHPLDTVKVRAQISPKGMFKSPSDIILKTIRKEGLFALYKGMASPLLGIAAQNSLLFTAFSFSKRLVSDTPDLSVGQTAAAGALAGAANSVLASPVELFKIRMQAQYGGTSDRKLSQVARDVWNESGFRNGVMRGFWITVLREIPAYAGFYSAFEASKRGFRSKLYPELGPEESLPVWCLMLSGSTGGIANWLACYPLDVVKSKVQLSNKPLSDKGIGYIAEEFRTIAREQGHQAFFRGLSPTLLRAIPAAAATFTTFELSKNVLEGL